jgi:hypothetical protein
VLTFVGLPVALVISHVLDITSRAICSHDRLG